MYTSLHQTIDAESQNRNPLSSLFPAAASPRLPPQRALIFRRVAPSFCPPRIRPPPPRDSRFRAARPLVALHVPAAGGASARVTKKPVTSPTTPAPGTSTNADARAAAAGVRAKNPGQGMQRGGQCGCWSWPAAEAPQNHAEAGNSCERETTVIPLPVRRVAARRLIRRP